jgi:hypothetical protein
MIDDHKTVLSRGDLNPKNIIQVLDVSYRELGGWYSEYCLIC